MTTLLSETHTPTSVNKGRRVLLISITRSGTLKQRKGTPGKCRRGGTGGSQGGEKKRTEDGHGVPPGPRPLPVPQPLRPRTTELGLPRHSARSRGPVQVEHSRGPTASHGDDDGTAKAAERRAGGAGRVPPWGTAAAAPAVPPQQSSGSQVRLCQLQPVCCVAFLTPRPACIRGAGTSRCLPAAEPAAPGGIRAIATVPSPVQGQLLRGRSISFHSAARPRWLHSPRAAHAHHRQGMMFIFAGWNGNGSSTATAAIPASSGLPTGPAGRR